MREKGLHVLYFGVIINMILNYFWLRSSLCKVYGVSATHFESLLYGSSVEVIKSTMSQNTLTYGLLLGDSRGSTQTSLLCKCSSSRGLLELRKCNCKTGCKTGFGPRFAKSIPGIFSSKIFLMCFLSDVFSCVVTPCSSRSNVCPRQNSCQC